MPGELRSSVQSLPETSCWDCLLRKHLGKCVEKGGHTSPITVDQSIIDREKQGPAKWQMASIQEGSHTLPDCWRKVFQLKLAFGIVAIPGGRNMKGKKKVKFWFVGIHSTS